MLVVLPLHFLLLLKKVLTAFFSTYDNSTDGIKQSFEQICYMIYGSIQNVLAIGITGRKIEDQVNQIAHFHQDNLVKEKMKSH